MAGDLRLRRRDLYPPRCGWDRFDSSKRTTAAGSEFIARSRRALSRAANAGTAADATTRRRAATATATGRDSGNGSAGISRRSYAATQAHAKQQTRRSHSAPRFQCTEGPCPDWEGRDDFQTANRVSVRSSSFEGHGKRHYRCLSRCGWQRHRCEHGPEHGQPDFG